MKCENTNCGHELSIKVEVEDPPQVLLIQLKRFENNLEK